MDEYREREGEGRELAGMHMKKIAKEAELFLAALKGFHRDLGLSRIACPDTFSADFLENPHGLMVPPHESTQQFSDFAEFFALADKTLNGTIEIKVNDHANGDAKAHLRTEGDITHRNLFTVVEAAQHLYQGIKQALLDFESFNTRNLEVGVPEYDIFFDRDALVLAMERARALGERAVRLDIDLVAALETLG